MGFLLYVNHMCKINIKIFIELYNTNTYQGRIQYLKLGGGALKKIAPSGGRRENFGGISSSNNKTLNAHLLARVITGCHYT